MSREQQKQFSTWLFRKQRELEDRLGRRVTQLEMAERIGITQPALSSYYRKVRLPTYENAQAIAEYFGDATIYDILDMPRPMPDDEDIQAIIRDVAKMKPEQRKHFRRLVENAMLRSQEGRPDGVMVPTS